MEQGKGLEISSRSASDSICILPVLSSCLLSLSFPISSHHLFLVHHIDNIILMLLRTLSTETDAARIIWNLSSNPISQKVILDNSQLLNSIGEVLKSSVHVSPSSSSSSSADSFSSAPSIVGKEKKKQLYSTIESRRVMSSKGKGFSRGSDICSEGDKKDVVISLLASLVNLSLHTDKHKLVTSSAILTAIRAVRSHMDQEVRTLAFRCAGCFLNIAKSSASFLIPKLRDFAE
eukprot:gnl/Carplike_NY0171/13321_a19426_99.p1 GENE.gnl/Carplike_NY0171/13321_a19426_99~~gnl/Carplike_NY0171/13321_a19426_99.p1  ORF type:complete len:261 (-),score=36.76 gnl/Carplike_NY0171/13321_a19426_99:317-1015(-)